MPDRPIPTQSPTPGERRRLESQVRFVHLPGCVMGACDCEPVAMVPWAIYEALAAAEQRATKAEAERDAYRVVVEAAKGVVGTTSATTGRTHNALIRALAALEAESDGESRAR